MKNTLLKFLLTITILNSASGALYTLGNGSGSTAAGIEDTLGRTFRSGTTAGASFTGTNGGVSAGPGVIAFGFFSTDAIANVQTASGLVSLFTQFGSTVTFNGGGTSGSRSIFSSAQSASITNGGFAGKNIYLFAGNGTSLLESTAFLVAKMDSELFLSGDDAANSTTPKLITINPSNSTALIGSEILNVWTTNSDATTNAGWQMAVLVPEASTSLLGAIGALALLRRRRN